MLLLDCKTSIFNFQFSIEEVFKLAHFQISIYFTAILYAALPILTIYAPD